MKPPRDGRLDPGNPNHLNSLRYLLLDFIADFANWDASTEPHYLETARALTQAAHEALGGEPGTQPLVVDPSSPAAGRSRWRRCEWALTPLPAT